MALMQDDPLQSAAGGPQSSSEKITTYKAQPGNGHDTHKSVITDQGPRSSYYFGPPSKDRAFGTSPVGVIGRDKPREIIRVERDYSGGELCQFHPTFPLELEGRITPTTFSEAINDINVILIRAFDARWALFDNLLAVLSLYISPWLVSSKYEREMKQLTRHIDQTNERDFHPAGLHLRYPSDTAMLFLELEYY